MSPEKAHKLSVCPCPHPPLQVSTFITVSGHSGSLMEYLGQILTDRWCAAFSRLQTHSSHLSKVVTSGKTFSLVSALDFE